MMTAFMSAAVGAAAATPGLRAQACVLQFSNDVRVEQVGAGRRAAGHVGAGREGGSGAGEGEEQAHSVALLQLPRPSLTPACLPACSPPQTWMWTSLMR